MTSLLRSKRPKRCVPIAFGNACPPTRVIVFPFRGDALDRWPYVRRLTEACHNPSLASADDAATTTTTTPSAGMQAFLRRITVVDYENAPLPLVELPASCGALFRDGMDLSLFDATVHAALHERPKPYWPQPPHNVCIAVPGAAAVDSLRTANASDDVDGDVAAARIEQTLESMRGMSAFFDFLIVSDPIEQRTLVWDPIVERLTRDIVSTRQFANSATDGGTGGGQEARAVVYHTLDTALQLFANALPRDHVHALRATDTLLDALLDHVCAIGGTCVDTTDAFRSFCARAVPLACETGGAPTHVPFEVVVAFVHELCRRMWHRFPLSPRAPAVFFSRGATTVAGSNTRRNTFSLWHEADCCARRRPPVEFEFDAGSTVDGIADVDDAANRTLVEVARAWTAEANRRDRMHIFDRGSGTPNEDLERAWLARDDASRRARAVLATALPASPFVDGDIIDVDLWTHVFSRDHLASSGVQLWLCGGAAGRGMRGEREEYDDVYSDLDLYVLVPNVGDDETVHRRLFFDVFDALRDYLIARHASPAGDAAQQLWWYRCGHVYTFFAPGARTPLQVQMYAHGRPHAVGEANVETLLAEYDLSHVQCGFGGGGGRGAFAGDGGTGSRIDLRWTASVHAWSSALFRSATTLMWNDDSSSWLSTQRVVKAYQQRFPIAHHTFLHDERYSFTQPFDAHNVGPPQDAGVVAASDSSGMELSVATSSTNNSERRRRWWWWEQPGKQHSSAAAFAAAWRRYVVGSNADDAVDTDRFEDLVRRWFTMSTFLSPRSIGNARSHWKVRPSAIGAGRSFSDGRLAVDLRGQLNGPFATVENVMHGVIERRRRALDGRVSRRRPRDGGNEPTPYTLDRHRRVESDVHVDTTVDARAQRIAGASLGRTNRANGVFFCTTPPSVGLSRWNVFRLANVRCRLTMSRYNHSLVIEDDAARALQRLLTNAFDNDAVLSTTKRRRRVRHHHESNDGASLPASHARRACQACVRHGDFDVTQGRAVVVRDGRRESKRRPAEGTATWCGVPYERDATHVVADVEMRVSGCTVDPNCCRRPTFRLVRLFARRYETTN